jgi:hypothetical protein
LLRNSYTVKNESGRNFQNLFTNFSQMVKILKCRFVDRFEYGAKPLMKLVPQPNNVFPIDEFSEQQEVKYHIVKLREEELFLVFLYLDFNSLRNVLYSCHLLYTYLKDEKNIFWYNLYSMRFGKPHFMKIVGNWGMIYRKKLKALGHA